MKKVHFIGIGGSGMNAVAGIAHGLGYEVSGCDAKESEYWDDLKQKGIPISLGHASAHLGGVDIVCITPAILHQKEKPEEYLEAQRRGLLIMTWQEFLGSELQKGKEVIAIAGTKGKTTTTGMVGYLLEQAGLDPCVVVGGKMLDWGRNYRVGQGNYFVCEADEFNNSFLHYHPNIAVITNIEMDHPEFFTSEEEYYSSFIRFVRNIRPGGMLIVNNDSPGVQLFLHTLGENVPFAILRYGVTAGVSNIMIESVRTVDEVTGFTLNGLSSEVASFQTSLSGLHNIYNFVAAIVIADLLQVPIETIQEAVKKFSGVGRRFELVVNKRGIKVYNDYAHNPMSVQAVLAGARQKYPSARIWAIFQPHLYSRTKMFMEQFANAFNSANEVIVLDIFASREKGMPIAQEVDSQMLADRIYTANPKLHVRSIPEKEKAVEVLLDELRPGDVVVNMGAGDNGIITELLSKQL